MRSVKIKIMDEIIGQAKDKANGTRENTSYYIQVCD